MAETKRQKRPQERTLKKEEDTVKEASGEITEHDLEEGRGEGTLEEVSEVKEKAAVEAAPPEEIAPQEVPPHNGTILQHLMSVPSFRRRVISCLVKKLQ